MGECVMRIVLRNITEFLALCLWLVVVSSGVLVAFAFAGALP